MLDSVKKQFSTNVLKIINMSYPPVELSDPMLSATASKEATVNPPTYVETLFDGAPINYDPCQFVSDYLPEMDTHIGSLDSGETYSESEISFQDSRSVSPQNDEDLTSESDRSTPQSQKLMDEATFERDRKLVQDRFAPYDLFPADNTWTLKEKVDLLLQLSPCTKYSESDLMNIDSLSPEDKVEMLISLAAKAPANFRWNYVKPEELIKSYTVVTNCKKEKKKDSEGNSSPKRPMNAFMIWSMKCRGIIAHICPQLHNAIISTQLGKAWRQFTDEEKALYEREKETLTSFHRHEFPDYKYKPRKKPKKSEEKPAPVPKPKANKRKKTENCQPATLRGIDIADSHQNLNPVLKERLQVKMQQVKIDPNYKKVHGKKDSLVRITENACYVVSKTEEISPPPMKTLRFDTNYAENNQSLQENLPTPPIENIIGQQENQESFLDNTQDIKPLIVDGKVVEDSAHLNSMLLSTLLHSHPSTSSVFLTPENSPSNPISPETNGSNPNFSYDQPLLPYDISENNNNNIIKSEPVENPLSSMPGYNNIPDILNVCPEASQYIPVPATPLVGTQFLNVESIEEHFLQLLEEPPTSQNIKIEDCVQLKEAFEKLTKHLPLQSHLDDLSSALLSS